MPLKYRHRLWPHLLGVGAIPFEELLQKELPQKAMEQHR